MYRVTRSLKGLRGCTSLEEVLNDNYPLFEGTKADITEQMVHIAGEEQKEKGDNSVQNNNEEEHVEPPPKVDELLAAVAVLERGFHLELDSSKALQLSQSLRSFRRTLNTETFARTNIQTNIASFFPKV